ncbi:MAG: dihydrolipoyl dehydrogenase [Pseudomonadota bacterium]
MAQTYDVAVIGAGPGGYVAAIRCAQLGLDTVCIDAFKNPQGKASLGGTCLNVGCIPSKALLESSENFHKAKHEFAVHGVKVSGVALDLATMMARKDKIVAQFTGGIAMLLRKNKVAAMHGTARFVSGGEVYTLEVDDAGKQETVTARHVIIATGSSPRHFDFSPVDGELIVDNAGALAFDAVPPRLGIIGAGVIGLELGSVWRRLGSEVTILEALPTFLAAADEQVAKEAWRTFTKEQGLAIQLGVKIAAVKAGKKQVTVEYADAEGSHKLAFNRLIVATGRVPNSASVNAAAVGVEVDTRGFIAVDEHCRTHAPNVYAVGDVVRGAMLAHKASEEGVMVAELIAGQAGHVDYDVIPAVIYTAPEIAWVGKTEQQLKADGVAYSVGQFPFSANGRARALGAGSGFAKMLTDAASDRILGVHIIGPCAGELIAEAVTAMAYQASGEDVARTIHAHPSLSEALHEAALAANKRALHI